jgi:NACalpha-BTF3-like transcription factor
MIIEEASLISEQSKLSFDECYQILKEEKGDIGAASARINEKK